MLRFANRCEAFASDESGATSIEYALIACIVSISIAVALTDAKTELLGIFNKVGTELKSNSSN